MDRQVDGDILKPLFYQVSMLPDMYFPCKQAIENGWGKKMDFKKAIKLIKMQNRNVKWFSPLQKQENLK